MNQRHVGSHGSLGENRRPFGVDAQGRSLVRLGVIDVVVGRRVDDQRRRRCGDGARDCGRVGDIAIAMIQGRERHVRGCGMRDQLAAQLTFSSEHQDQSANPNRSPR